MTGEEKKLLKKLLNIFSKPYGKIKSLNLGVLLDLIKQSKKDLDIPVFNETLNEIQEFTNAQPEHFLDEDFALELRLAISQYSLKLHRTLELIFAHHSTVSLQILQLLTVNTPESEEYEQSKLECELRFKEARQDSMWVEIYKPITPKRLSVIKYFELTSIVKDLNQLETNLAFYLKYIGLIQWLLDENIKSSAFRLSISEPDAKNPYPNIFYKGNGWRIFKHYVDTCKFGPSNGVFSYLYRQMINDGYIWKNLYHKDYKPWIYSQYEIDLTRIKTLKEISIEPYAYHYYQTLADIKTKSLFLDND
ncbi:hypothetical protein [uncultured Arcticibacterium sp.]|uniref:hypothetical protein n=1 Tax=uncultured Arcticibacterium sp. TaxID=2173042 RepID=UPI0030FA5DEA